MITDNIKLLEAMLIDSKNIDEIYKPTNYWQWFVDKIVCELKKDGIGTIRNKKSKLFNVFGGSEVQVEYFRIQTSLFPLRLIFHRDFVKKYFSVLASIDKKRLQDLAYYQCFYLDQFYGVNKLKDISIDTDSFSGASDDIFIMNGKSYTVNFLQYYLQYVYMSRFINFDKIKTFVDLGCGMSKVSEIVHKLHPRVTILLFDIVPTVYFTELYMQSVFPDSVIGYNETSLINDLELKEGKIYIFPNWKFPILKKFSSIDVFMNSGSFQEMEPEVVDNYLSFIKYKAKYVYLRAAMNGSEKAKGKGSFGSMCPVTFKDYKRNLSGYSIKDYSEAIFPLMVKKMYTDVLFRDVL